MWCLVGGGRVLWNAVWENTLDWIKSTRPAEKYWEKATVIWRYQKKGRNKIIVEKNVKAELQRKNNMERDLRFRTFPRRAAQNEHVTQRVWRSPQYLHGVRKDKHCQVVSEVQSTGSRFQGFHGAHRDNAHLAHKKYSKPHHSQTQHCFHVRLHANSIL